MFVIILADDMGYSNIAVTALRSDAEL